jgi:serine phosphatase RsbU (regulator of sigma subunit)
MEILDREVIRTAARGGSAQRLPATVSVAGQRNHVVVLPLTSRAQPLGVMVLGRSEPLDAVTFMATLELARRAALAVDNARLHEEAAATATALQASLLPTALPEIEGVELAARYHSASPGMLVGGDFYDAVSVGDGSFVFAIGDVCGKGAEAAAVTGMSRDLLRFLVQDGQEMSAALRRLNRALVEHPNSSRFCTVALARLLRRDDDLVARVCLAGHPEPMVLRADGSTELVGTPGDLLGVLPDDDLDLEVSEVRLAPGDALVLYTDGVTERREGQRMFGQHGLRTTLERSKGASAETIASNIDQAARTFVDAEMLDDLAILVLRHTA